MQKMKIIQLYISCAFVFLYLFDDAEEKTNTIETRLRFGSYRVRQFAEWCITFLLILSIWCVSDTTRRRICELSHTVRKIDTLLMITATIYVCALVMQIIIQSYEQSERRFVSFNRTNENFFYCQPKEHNEISFSKISYFIVFIFVLFVRTICPQVYQCKRYCASHITNLIFVIPLLFLWTVYVSTILQIFFLSLASLTAVSTITYDVLVVKETIHVHVKSIGTSSDIELSVPSGTIIPRTGPMYVYVNFLSFSKFQWYIFTVLSNYDERSNTTSTILSRFEPTDPTVHSLLQKRNNFNTSANVVAIRMIGPYNVLYDSFDIMNLYTFPHLETQTVTPVLCKRNSQLRTITMRNDTSKLPNLFICSDSGIFFALDMLQNFTKLKNPPRTIVIWLIRKEAYLTYLETFLVRNRANVRFRNITFRVFAHNDSRMHIRHAWSLANVKTVIDSTRDIVPKFRNFEHNIADSQILLQPMLHPDSSSVPTLHIEHVPLIQILDIVKFYVRKDTRIHVCCDLFIRCALSSAIKNNNSMLQYTYNFH